ncbi:Hypothetical protein R9X50_00487000 [Acrodontium crateriforme]|uniref:Peptidase M24 domain-containing protein n=1 Tax=Acrodontium crateriforme TaxID=150365 RepID=A0AAQ3R5F9_9PEZI|nr:Hypothetical protein R9X50_00487000 [Acrodontium crateriforme]
MAIPNSETEEQSRASYLQDAQDKASRLFDEIERDLIRPGVMESELSKQIHELGQKRHNVRTHWHKRVVRSGPNTLKPYAENPLDRKIGEDDILFVDLGPVFEQWEADFGRTFVLGNDPVKHKLRDSLEPAWKATKAYFDADVNISGEQLYAFACAQAMDAGWEFGGAHSGHLVGDFPHERIPNDKISFYITEGNSSVMRSKDDKGQKRHWILEMHLVDREGQIGGFMEQLLTVG